MEKVVKDKLWTRSFCAVAAGNFLLFFAFYLLLPVLPMYLSEAFAASRSTSGFILSSYTITALMIRPFAGYMVDTFPRKPLLLICYFAEPDVLIQNISGSVIPKHFDLHLGAPCTLVQV